MTGVVRTPEPSAFALRKVVAYVMSRFPKVTETFILNEIVRLPRWGLQVEVYPLIRQSESIVHDEAEAVASKAHFTTWWSWRFWWNQVYWLRRSSRTYFATWWAVFRGNWRSAGFLVRALVIMPKAAAMARHMVENGIEHVHAHWATHPALAAYCIHRLAGIPYSMTIHAHDLYMSRTMLREKVHAAAFVVTISEYNRQLLGTLCGTEILSRVRVVRCGVDLERFQPDSTMTESSIPIVACVAGLEPYKGHTHLIEACFILRQRKIAFECLLIGQGSRRKSLEKQIASSQLEANVRLMGPRTHREVREILGKASVFVLASVVEKNGRTEGIPTALMEAMAMEIPVVATQVSGIPELVEHEHTGLLVPPENAERLADAIHRILSDPPLAEAMVQAGASRVRERYNLETNVEELAQLLCHGTRKGGA